MVPSQIHVRAIGGDVIMDPSIDFVKAVARGETFFFATDICLTNLFWVCRLSIHTVLR